jgi:membrane protease YdiL (CAAX protease family)
MAGWLERAAGPGGLSLALVWLEVLAGLILVGTVLHFRRAKGTAGELKAVRTYFAAWAVLLLAVPAITIALTSAKPLALFAAAGWTPGRAGLGLTIAILGLPVAAVLAVLSSRDPDMRRMYPLAKAVLADGRTFAAYEVCYFFMYYLPWESVFRGVLFLPLVPVIGLVPALVLQAAVSTLLHLGHPWPEFLAAAVAGLAFGLIAYATGSFFYPLVLHAAAGIVNDTSIFLDRRRGRP